MTGPFIVGCLCLIGGAIGVLMNFRMTTSRPNPLFAFGNVLFFIGPIVLGMRTIAHSLNDLAYFAFGFAAVGVVVMGVGLAVGRRRRDRV